MGDPVQVGYDLDFWERWGAKMPLAVPIMTNPHWMICGASGSGKSYFVMYFLRNLLREAPDSLIIYFCDFKSSEDFSFLRDYQHYYTGEDCAKGLTEYYTEYQQVKAGKITDNKLRLLFFDEWAGFIVWETQRDKKQAESYKAMLLEVLLMGRSMHCGIIAIMQRPDAAYLPGREQFFVSVAFGKLSPEMKKMVIPGEDIERRAVYDPGEGIISSDRFGVKPLKVPRLKSVPAVQQEILSHLARASNAGAAPGGESG